MAQSGFRIPDEDKKAILDYCNEKDFEYSAVCKVALKLGIGLFKDIIKKADPSTQILIAKGMVK